MKAATVALTHLEAALTQEAPGAEELAEKLGPTLWLLAGAPDLTPPEPPPALAAALAAIPMAEVA